MIEQNPQASPYQVKIGKIVRVEQMTEKEKLFEITFPDGTSLGHKPGQFVMVSLAGIGEAPISVSSSPTKPDSFDLCVRQVSRLTTIIHKLAAGNEIGIRGPFGAGFPVETLEGNDLLFVAAGLGIAPLRSLINYTIDNRRLFGKVNILLGCKMPQDILFKEEIVVWSQQLDVNFSCTVDKADAEWRGNIGLITSLIPGVTIEPERTFAIVVGPPVMYKPVISELIAKGLPDRQILVSLERHMKCGLGKCGHCQIGGLYCCQEGPVFNYAKIKNQPEAF